MKPWAKIMKSVATCKVCGVKVSPYRLRDELCPACFGKRLEV